MAYYQLETNDAIDGAKHKAIDSSQLTPALSQMSMDSSPQSTPSSPSKSSQVNYSINSKSPFKSLPTTILYDIRFDCNRWFGRNIEEGSTERVLIGELLSGSS
ncbi:unnamed protein product, partial [Medioppia subpectinata]